MLRPLATTIFCLGCGRQTIHGLDVAPTKEPASPVETDLDAERDNDGDETGRETLDVDGLVSSVILQNSPLDIAPTIFPVERFCSNWAIQLAQSSVKAATTGIVVKLYPRIPDGFPPTSGLYQPPSEPPIVIGDDAAEALEMQSTILDLQSLRLNLTGIADGMYDLALCDRSYSDRCQLKHGAGPQPGLLATHADIKITRGRATPTSAIRVAAGEHPTLPIGSVGGSSDPPLSYRTQPLSYLLEATSTEPLTGDCDFIVSPLLVAIGSTKVELGPPSAGIELDLDNDGKNELISSVKSASAYFLITPPANATRFPLLFTGQNMFGNYTVGPDGCMERNGFDALKKLDSNVDNMIDAADQQFQVLRLWHDGNRNGLAEMEELHALAEAKVRSIRLDYDDGTMDRDSFGNEFRQRSVVEMTDGTIAVAIDVWFRKH